MVAQIRILKILLILILVVLILTRGIYRCEADNICYLEGKMIEGDGVIRECTKKSQGTRCIINKIGIKQNQSDVNREYKGALLTYLYSNENFQPGDKVVIKGEVQVPKNFNNFNYKGYLAKDNIYGILKKTNLSLSGFSYNEKKWASWQINRWTGSFKGYVYDKVEFLWEKDSGFIKAFLFGDKSWLLKEEKDDFNKVGISHVIAVSGMHMGIFANFFRRILLRFFIKKDRVNLITSVLLLVFLVFISFPSSACRAFLMLIISYVGSWCGRKMDYNLSLFWVGIIMLFINPMLLFYDVGFLLSFFCMLGIFNIYPILKNFSLNFFDKSKIFWPIIEVFLITLSVQITTFPVMVLFFEKITLLTFVSNILIFFALPPLFIFSFLAICFSFFNNFLALLAAFIANFFMNYISILVDYLQGFDFLVMEIEKNYFFIIGYFIIFWWIYYLFLRKYKLSYDNNFLI